MENRVSVLVTGLFRTFFRKHNFYLIFTKLYIYLFNLVYICIFAGKEVIIYD
jgi:hypothetical protein